MSLLCAIYYVRRFCRVSGSLGPLDLPQKAQMGDKALGDIFYTFSFPKGLGKTFSEFKSQITEVFIYSYALWIFQCVHKLYIVMMLMRRRSTRERYRVSRCAVIIESYPVNRKAVCYKLPSTLHNWRNLLLLMTATNDSD